MPNGQNSPALLIRDVAEIFIFKEVNWGICVREREAITQLQVRLESFCLTMGNRKGCTNRDNDPWIP